MISIITAVHNQLEMNKLFAENLRKYTYHPYELIIIDNNSTDGSREFFKSIGARVIENSGNYSYPYTQNQGIEIAKYNIYGFLNNDIIVAPHWDKHLMDAMKENNLNIITCCGIERVENPAITKYYGRRWKLIKNVIGGIIGKSSARQLSTLHKLMYGNWERFSSKRFSKFKYQVVEGFVGNTVVFDKIAIEKIGLWDNRIQAADFDLYMRSRKRYMEQGDLKPCHIALGVFNHHFIRLTQKSKPPVFSDAGNMTSLEAKWGQEALDKYLQYNVST